MALVEMAGMVEMAGVAGTADAGGIRSLLVSLEGSKGINRLCIS